MARRGILEELDRWPGPAQPVPHGHDHLPAVFLEVTARRSSNRRRDETVGTNKEHEMILKVRDHMNKNHLSEDGEPEKPWTEADVASAALYIGLELIMKNHKIK